MKKIICEEIKLTKNKPFIWQIMLIAFDENFDLWINYNLFFLNKTPQELFFIIFPFFKTSFLHLFNIKFLCFFLTFSFLFSLKLLYCKELFNVVILNFNLDDFS